MSTHCLDGALAVVGFEQHIHAQQLRETGAHGKPQRGVIVNDQDGCHALLPCGRATRAGQGSSLTGQYMEIAPLRLWEVSAIAV
ncbi:hypothetical protein D3C86_1920860 [compost metagenome]